MHMIYLPFLKRSRVPHSAVRVSIFLHIHNLLLGGLPIQLLNSRIKIGMTKERQEREAEEERKRGREEEKNTSR
jgi:hypothetical protein